MAMALVHKKLYQAKDLSWLDLREYIIDLLDLLMRSLGQQTKLIELKTDIDRIMTTIDTAIPCGLILNELFTNSIKHAFPDDRKGEIRISLKSSQTDEITLKVIDDGVGVPKNFNLRAGTTYGLQSVIALVEHQLSGKLNLVSEKGTEIEVQFKDPAITVRL